MGKKNRHAFVSLPLQKFIRILETVGKKYGISVQQEESYTSKADFLCRDETLVYKEEGGSRPVFSGKLERRRLYASGCGEGCMDSADTWNYMDFYPLRKKTDWVSQPIA